MNLAAHPGLSRALTAVRGAEIGLLRAVAVDLVVADTSAGGGDALGMVGPTAADILRRATGPASVDLQSHATADGGAVTFLGRTERTVVVNAHVSVVAGAHREYVRATARFVGTHGSVFVDLLRPALDVRTATGTTRVPFGAPGPDVAPGETAAILSAIADSARSAQTVSTTW